MRRLKDVITGKQGGISESVNWQGGGDFIYCDLMEYNQTFINKIQTAKSSEELVNIFHVMSNDSFLYWYVNAEFSDEMNGDPESAEAYFISIGDLEAQKHLLVELLDKNQLYVNLSEIEDADFEVSDEDKALNKEFYEN